VAWAVPVGYALVAVERQEGTSAQDQVSSSAGVDIPRFADLMWPTLQALKALGGSAAVRDIYDKVVEFARFTEEQQNVSHGRYSEIEYRLAWARSYLKTVGALENRSRGAWSVTDKGRGLTEADMARIPAQVRATRPRAEKEPRPPEPVDDDSTEFDWKTELLDSVLALPPDSFERLCMRLLRKAGFISVRVTGRPGDEGIDGMGVYQMALVSFPVYFQAKRYRGTVRAGAVRDFRGAMSGRGDKGLLITTGRFTADAKQEATREGPSPIDLIDGDRLCDLLKEHSLGVATVTRTIDEVTIQKEFFGDL
jgi:restriction system protein